jgi:hypothetical protein
MKSTLIIKDLSLDKELGGKAKSALRGGNSQESSNSSKSSNSSDISQALVSNLTIGPVGVLSSGGIKLDVHNNPQQNAYSYQKNFTDQAHPFFPVW